MCRRIDKELFSVSDPILWADPPKLTAESLQKMSQPQQAQIRLVGERLDRELRSPHRASTASAQDLEAFRLSPTLEDAFGAYTQEMFAGCYAEPQSCRLLVRKDLKIPIKGIVIVVHLLPFLGPRFVSPPISEALTLNTFSGDQRALHIGEA